MEQAQRDDEVLQLLIIPGAASTFEACHSIRPEAAGATGQRQASASAGAASAASAAAATAVEASVRRRPRRRSRRGVLRGRSPSWRSPCVPCAPSPCLPASGRLAATRRRGDGASRHPGPELRLSCPAARQPPLPPPQPEPLPQAMTGEELASTSARPGPARRRCRRPCFRRLREAVRGTGAFVFGRIRPRPLPPPAPRRPDAAA